MPQINLSQVGPKFTRPELLCHGQIPAPMAGVAPRLIEGQAWWDVVRRQAYAANMQYCWACGGEGPLEAHEVYEIDYEKGRMKFVEVCALCAKCHNFIHNGRYGRLLSKRRIKKSVFEETILHGYTVLKKAGLRPHWGLFHTLLSIYKFRFIIIRPKWLDEVLEACEHKPASVEPNWDSWRMEYKGKLYKPKYSPGQYISTYRSNA